MISECILRSLHLFCDAFYDTMDSSSKLDEFNAHPIPSKPTPLLRFLSDGKKDEVLLDIPTDPFLRFEIPGRSMRDVVFLGFSGIRYLIDPLRHFFQPCPIPLIPLTQKKKSLDDCQCRVVSCRAPAKLRPFLSATVAMPLLPCLQPCVINDLT